jgi:hypothetical protein
VKDFIGYDVASFVAQAELYASACPSDSDGDGDWFGGMQDRRYIRPSTFLAHVSAMIRTYGWVSRKDAEATMDRHPTSMLAYMNMFPKGLTSKRIPLIEEDFKTAELTIAWATTRPCNSEFDHNMAVLAGAEMIEYRSIGTLAYAVQGFNRYTEASFLKAQAAASMGLSNSRHVGKEGDKFKDVKAVLFGYNTTPGNYGTVSIYKFQTENGNVLTWFSSKEIEGLGATAAKARTPVTISGTVSGHSEYQGVKQTKVTRCKVVIG